MSDPSWPDQIPAFGTIKECPKCRGMHWGRRYVPGIPGSYYDPPHITLTCCSCGAEVMERPADWGATR